MTEQRRLAAILVADVAGYSKLMGSDEAGTLAKHQEQPVGHRQPRPGSLPVKHIQLVSQHCDLGFQMRLRPEGRSQCVDEQT